MTYKLKRIIPSILLVISTAVSLFAFASGYNEKTGYLIKSPGTIALYVVIAIGVLFAAWCALSTPKNHAISYNKKAFIPASLLLHMISACCIPLATITGAKFVIGSSMISAIRTLLIVCCWVALITTPLIQLLNRSLIVLSPINTCVTVLFCLSAITLFYFDHSVEMNNPQKIFLQLALAAICLSTLATLRLLIYGNGIRLFTFAKLCTAILSPTATVAALFARSSNEKFFANIYFYVAIIVGVYAIFDAFTLLFSKIEISNDSKDDPSPNVALDETAKENTKES